jgi:integrase
MFMVTLKFFVSKECIKKDGTGFVRLRITHDRKIKIVQTNIVFGIEDLKKPKTGVYWGIKSPNLIDIIADKEREFRKICNANADQIERMDTNQIADFLLNHNHNKSFDLDFIDFGYRHANIVEKQGRVGSANGYRTALNALKRFIRDDTLNIGKITSKFVEQFVDFLKTEEACHKGRGSERKGSRKESLYPSIIRAIHNAAKREFNDEDTGVIPISSNPFHKVNLPKHVRTRKRALTLEQMQKIIDLLNDNSLTQRVAFARDIFILSFGLIGMNSADMYACTELDGDLLTYERQKTSGRRADKARITVRIEPEVKTLFAKYRNIGAGNVTVFDFVNRYSTAITFNGTLNRGLKRIGAMIGEPDLQFYSARHTWATLAINVAKVDKYTVHEALNHVDGTMKITDTYIEKDFSLIWEANKKVLGLFAFFRR